MKYDQAMKSKDKKEWKEAVKKEKKSFKKLNTKIHFFKGQTFSAAQWLYKELGIKQLPMCLDFASDSNPGGSYKTNQQGTQEEALFR